MRRTCDRIIAGRRADGTDHGLTDAEISDTIIGVFLAGTETTASALAWALELLALRPGIQQRLHTEVDTVLCGAPATHTDLPRLALTERIITEALRLYSPGWFVTRTVTEDTHLGKYPLPAGTSVAYSPYLIHHRPDLYANSETFDPDRWNPRHPQPPPGPPRTGSSTETA